MSQDPSQAAYDLLAKLRASVDEDGAIEGGDEIALLENLVSRVQALEAGQAQVDYNAQQRAARDEAEAKRDLAKLLLSTALKRSEQSRVDCAVIELTTAEQYHGLLALLLNAKISGVIGNDPVLDELIEAVRDNAQVPEGWPS